jgi:hypothetical protein
MARRVSGFSAAPSSTENSLTLERNEETTVVMSAKSKKMPHAVQNM